MKKGVDELVDVLNEIKDNATSNPCGMSDAVMSSLAHALRSLYKTKVPKKLSIEKASCEVGVSPRQLKRLANASGITPRRDGFRNVYYTEEDIEAIRAYKTDKPH